LGGLADRPGLLGYLLAVRECLLDGLNAGGLARLGVNVRRLKIKPRVLGGLILRPRLALLSILTPP